MAAIIPSLRCRHCHCNAHPTVLSYFIFASATSIIYVSLRLYISGLNFSVIFKYLLLLSSKSRISVSYLLSLSTSSCVSAAAFYDVTSLHCRPNIIIISSAIVPTPMLPQLSGFTNISIVLTPPKFLFAAPLSRLSPLSHSPSPLLLSLLETCLFT